MSSDMSILVVMEQRAGSWNRMSFETLSAAQHLARELGSLLGRIHQAGILHNDLHTGNILVR